MKLTKVLMAVDEPALSQRIVKAACNFFDKENTEITLINVCETDGIKDEYFNIAPEKFIEHESKKNELIIMENYLIQHGYKYKEFLFFEGNPADTIINIANKEKFDLVVVGSHNKSEIDRLLLGSVSYKVALNCKSSVMIIKNVSLATGLSQERNFDVLFSVDNSDFHKVMTNKINDLIDIKRSKFTILTVTPDVYNIIPPDAFIYTDIEKIQEEAKNVATETLNKVSLELTKKHGSIKEKLIIEGDAAEEIVKLAKEKTFPLTVLGSRGKTAFSGWLLGSVSSKIATYSSTSVLILKK